MRSECKLFELAYECMRLLYRILGVVVCHFRPSSRRVQGTLSGLCRLKLACNARAPECVLAANESQLSGTNPEICGHTWEVVGMKERSLLAYRNWWKVDSKTSSVGFDLCLGSQRECLANSRKNRRIA